MALLVVLCGISISYAQIVGLSMTERAILTDMCSSFGSSLPPVLLLPLPSPFLLSLFDRTVGTVITVNNGIPFSLVLVVSILNCRTSLAVPM